MLIGCLSAASGHLAVGGLAYRTWSENKGATRRDWNLQWGARHWTCCWLFAVHTVVERCGASWIRSSFYGLSLTFDGDADCAFSTKCGEFGVGSLQVLHHGL
eukprot:1256956-Amphidinium_carterae.3